MATSKVVERTTDARDKAPCHYYMAEGTLQLGAAMVVLAADSRKREIVPLADLYRLERYTAMGRKDGLSYLLGRPGLGLG